MQAWVAKPHDSGLEDCATVGGGLSYLASQVKDAKEHALTKDIFTTTMDSMDTRIAKAIELNYNSKHAKQGRDLETLETGLKELVEFVKLLVVEQVSRPNFCFGRDINHEGAIDTARGKVTPYYEWLAGRSFVSIQG
jgi:hypothetical protein